VKGGEGGEGEESKSREGRSERGEGEGEGEADQPYGTFSDHSRPILDPQEQDDYVEHLRLHNRASSSSSTPPALIRFPSIS